MSICLFIYLKLGIYVYKQIFENPLYFCDYQKTALAYEYNQWIFWFRYELLVEEPCISPYSHKNLIFTMNRFCNFNQSV